MAARRNLGWIVAACAACAAAVVAATWSTRSQSSPPAAAVTLPADAPAAANEHAVDVAAGEPAPRRVALEATDVASAPTESDVPTSSFADPGTDGSEKRPRSELAQRIDGVTGTFASPEPDTRGLLALVRDLANDAHVVEGSVTKSETGDVISGRLALTGSIAQCRFEREGDRLTIEMYESGTIGVPGAIARNVSWTMSRADGSIVCTVQHQLDTQTATTNEEHVIGWSTRSNAQGTHASAITMIGNANAWKVGPSEKIPVLDQPWLSESGASAAWWSLVDPYAK